MVIGGGTGPVDGTNAVTSTPGKWAIHRMLQSAESFPINLGFLGKGSGKLQNINVENVNNNPYFKIYYSLVLDKIRIFYNKLGGFSNMSSSKIYKLYTDEKMKIVQHKFMPEEQFIKLYVECIQNIKYENIQNLYTYSIRDISKEIDFDNIRLSLGNRQH